MFLKKIIIPFLTYLIFALSLNAQDLHFSNYQDFSNYFNPATTGITSPDLTLGIQYRGQWGNIPNAYRTAGINLQKREKNFAWGGLLHSNGAGSASLKTTGGLMTTAIYRQLAKGDNQLALGVGLGFIQRSFNPSAFSFDAQYSLETGYDFTNSNQENFLQTNSSKVDFTVGLNWRNTFNREKNIKSNLGFALAHVHVPNIGFTEEISPLPMKLVLHGDLDFPFSSKSRLTPHFLFQKQGVHQEFLFGFNISRELNEKTTLKSGLSLRLKDALIFGGGIDWGNKSMTLHYDLNNSRLSLVTQGRGAFELSFRFRFNKDSKPKKEHKDSDQDGIYDHVDQCPDVPGDKSNQGCPMADESNNDSDDDGVLDKDDDCPYIPGYHHLFGCPDSDKDGVIDKLDGCPNLPGIKENHGCPSDMRDTDKDGIPDAEDYCVFLYGLFEFKGCPDSDKDGVSDIDDDCPYMKGVVDNRGCPANEKSWMEQGTVVEFETNRYAIHPDFQEELDFLIEEFKELSNHKIIISGHTDSEGNAEFNYVLGKKRAFAIMKYLMKKGIMPSFIHTISYGEALPIKNNISDNGKARNRRAEVRIIPN